MNLDFKEIILIFLKGLFMGSADIVPGVSGGTIALITGIYERLISAISSIKFSFLKPLLKANFSDFKDKLIEEIDFELFIPLILGIAIAFITLAKVISYLLDTQTAYTFSFFLGLILASAYILYTRLENFNIKLIIIICAMILPGISGSFLLLLLGQYQYMLNALNSRNFIEIFVFGIGAVIGILGFSKLLNYLLERYESATMAFLIGIMVGTLRLPLMKISTTIQGSWIPCIILALIAFVLIIVLEKKFKNKE